MDSVGLVELGLRGDAVEKERIEQRAIAVGEVGVDSVKGRRVFPAEIGRRPHSGQQHRKPALGKTGHQVVQRLPGDRRVDAAQRVVGAKLDDHGVGIGADRPVEPGKPVAGGVPGNATIDDDNIVAAGLKGALQPGREGGFGIEAVAGGQAVAESDDPDRLRRYRRRRKKRKRQDDVKRLDRHGNSTI